MDTKKLVNINIKEAADSFELYVRHKAAMADSTIVYGLNGRIVEEDPKTGKISILHPEVKIA